MSANNKKANKVRNSNIELFKIISIFLIIICHTVYSWGGIDLADMSIDLYSATTDVQTILLVFFRYFGIFGNAFFFICSAWFWVDSNDFRLEKEVFYVIEIWVVAVSILIICTLAKVQYGSAEMLRSLIPTFSGANWYMTCYLIFYPLHVVLNRVIERMDKPALFRAAVILTFLYIICNFIHRAFYSSEIIVWVAIYFVVAYTKKYLQDFCESVKANLILLLVCTGGHIALILLTNLFILKWSVFDIDLLYWNEICNPFMVFAAISVLNLARKIDFQSKLINKISSLTLLIYIIHEDIELRTYVRPVVINYFCRIFENGNVVLIVLLIALLTFIAAVVVSYLYTLTLQRIVIKISQYISKFIIKIWTRIENRIC